MRRGSGGGGEGGRRGGAVLHVGMTEGACPMPSCRGADRAALNLDGKTALEVAELNEQVRGEG